MRSILHGFSRICLTFMVFLGSSSMMAANQVQSNTEISAFYSPYRLSANAYLNEANRVFDNRQQDYQLMAVGKMLTEGQTSEARKLLNRIQVISQKQYDQKLILWAKYYLLERQASRTIEILSQVQGIEGLDLFYQCEYHELLSLAYHIQNQYYQAALQRMKLDALLRDAKVQLSNRQKMWQLLQDMPSAELNTQYLEAYDGSEWKGWLALLKMMKAGRFEQDYETWASDYPRHPAASIIKKPSRFSFFSKPTVVHNPNQIALLLPLSCPLAGPGQAVKEGFMAAYQAANAKQNILFYDTNQGGASKQYHRAMNEGAEMVLGPLIKNDAQVVASSFSSVPTLLLNDVSKSLSRDVLAFGYSPKDEASQLAEIMSQKGHRRVLMIVPANPWGQEVSAAFANSAARSGMTIIGAIQYEQRSQISRLLKDGLHYSERKQRNAKGKEETLASRRQDIDAIFILAYPSVARQIVPLLRYYYAGDIPQYATSAAYAAYYNPSQDKDLDGLYFTDIPWVFNHQIGHRAWPEQWNAYSRLYALGYDSFSLVKDWSNLQSMPDSGLNRETGVLYVQRDGHIRRELVLGQFHQGVAQEIHGS